MDHVTAFEHPQQPRTTTSLATDIADLAIRHKHGVSSLLASREDLRGVYAFADVVEESVRWCA